MGALSMNLIIFLFIVANCSLYKTPRAFIESYKSNMSMACEVIVQFPFYGGISFLGIRVSKMSWGVGLMYYHCPQCGKTFKYALDLMVEFGDDFGKCPVCGCMGTYEYDDPRRKDDNDYFEVE